MEQKTEESQAVDERALFEQAMNDQRSFPRELDFTMTKSPSGRDEYANAHLQSCWKGWQARAALKAQPAPTEAQGAAQHAIHNLKEFRAGRMPFPGEAIGILEAAIGQPAPTEVTQANTSNNSSSSQPSGNTGEMAQGEDSARLDWLGQHCTGASDSERYLPFRVYWGKGPIEGGEGYGIRSAIDKCRARASAETGGVKS